MSRSRSVDPTPRGREPHGAASQVRLLKPSLHAIDSLKVEALALCLTPQTRPLSGAAGYLDWRLCGGLSRMIEAGIVTGAAGEQVLMPTGGKVPAGRVFLFGWGDGPLADGAEERLAWMVEVLERAKVASVVVALPEPVGPLLGLVHAHLAAPLRGRLEGVFDADPLCG